MSLSSNCFQANYKNFPRLVIFFLHLVKCNFNVFRDDIVYFLCKNLFNLQRENERNIIAHFNFSFQKKSELKEKENINNS
jgi:hypothetical protein